MKTVFILLSFMISTASCKKEIYFKESIFVAAKENGELKPGVIFTCVKQGGVDTMYEQSTSDNLVVEFNNVDYGNTYLLNFSYDGETSRIHEESVTLSHIGVRKTFKL
jgi:hypothetical protein